MADDLIKILIDKGLLSIMLLIAGYWVSKYLEINKQTNELRNKLKENNREKILNAIEKQLSLFYYPIYFRLQKDNALWELSPRLSDDPNSLPIDTNDIIESEYILKNHREIVSVIENNIHFVEVDEELQLTINAYLKHIAVYETIRKIDALKSYNPIDFNAPYPELFENVIKARMTKLQQKNNDLLQQV
ncbi:hypothetical protein PDL71_02305 [Lacibacter sp. MH-610]|uniref:hypothetical protein n=1 Tax=Lacibacter sp. MH-610 TaxID=3020883 RepID=UPI0038928910